MKPHLLNIVRNYLKAIQNNKSFEELREFYHPEAIQIQYPNLLTKSIVQRNVDIIGDGFEKGKNILESQAYEVVRSYESEKTIIIEAIWTGKLKVPVGSKAAGEEMKAYFAQFFEFEGEKIMKQRNYDCFETF